MMARSHVPVAVAFHIAAGAFLPEYFPADQVATAAFGGLLADVDMKGSWAGQAMGPYGKFIRKFSGGHRNLTHEPWAPFVAGGLGCLLSIPFGCSIGMGYISHLIADTIYDTDGWLEHVIRWMIWIAIPIIIAYRMVY